MDGRKTPSVTADKTLEDYFTNSGSAGALKSLVRDLNACLAQSRFEDVAAVLRQVASPTLDFTSIQSLVRLYASLRGKVPLSTQRARLAILSSFTTTQLAAMLELFLFAGGVDAEFYEADFGVFRQEILDPSSALYAFRPQTLLLLTSSRDINHWPSITDDAERMHSHLESEWGEWSTLWQTAHQRLACQIIQNNFDQSPLRTLGNHESRQVSSRARFVARLNEQLADAPPYVTIHDVDHLSALAGRRVWGDDRFFHHAKLPCAPEFLVDYAHSLASVLLAQLGLGKKCLVLDLDNTLWGGVIGDDGLAGIRVGQGDAEGEGFLAFQRYVKELGRRGVILAVCSKNTDAVARDVFLKHPEMVLKLDDISCFVANWDDKASNIRHIAKQLNIGTNSLVFLDDNPAERAIVRQLLPEVAVPEVTGDPLDFINALERHRYFQIVSLGTEDIQRTEMYRGNAERDQIRDSAGNIDDFLKSLQMVAPIGPVTPMTLERTTQLINKSNQFNLTTIRRLAAEVLAISNDPNWLTRTVTLKDRFGDNGLICVLLAKIDGSALDIDTWLMSCRVLKRGVENFLLNHICQWAIGRGLTEIRGRYVPTSKNALVKDHYKELGFAVLGERDGACHYSLQLAQWKPAPVFIEARELE